MNKLQVTPLQRANALEALNNWWPTVNPAKVAERLNFWRADPNAAGEIGRHDVPDLDQPPRCGTVACFGGWLEWHVPFRQQAGLDPDKGEADLEDMFNFFGVTRNTKIFSERRCGCKADVDAAGEPFTGTDHELVSNRLRWLIENSEVVG